VSESSSPALDFKSANLYAVRIVLHAADLQSLTDALDKRMHDAGSFFENEPVVIDAEQISDPVDWTALVQALRDHRLYPIGVVAEGDNLEAARQAGLTGVELSSPIVRPASTPAADHEVPVVNPAAPAPEPAAAAAPEIAPAAMVVRRQLRSGQRIYARNTDLIIIGVVGHGAEVIADGNIHVYGPLRGKAMAGARGDESARIFASQLDPELLAIAGIYRVIEERLDPAQHNRPCLVQLENDKLEIMPLGK